MASIERTAYPRFRRLVTARELAALSPTEDEVAWARARARSPEHVLALVLSLKCFQRLGYFPRLGDVPSAVVDHVRRDLELPEGTNVSISPEVMILGLSHDYNDPTFRDLDAVRSRSRIMCGSGLAR